MLDQPEPKKTAGSVVSGFYKGEAYPAIRSQIYCKNCKRNDFHFLNIKSTIARLLVKTLSLGLVGIVGTYRCRCCGQKRIGRFDFIRGPETPKRQPLVRLPKKNEESFQSEQRRHRRISFFQKINPLNRIFASRDSWKSTRRRSRFQRFLSGLWQGRKKRSRRFKKRRNW